MNSLANITVYSQLVVQGFKLILCSIFSCDGGYDSCDGGYDYCDGGYDSVGKSISLRPDSTEPRPLQQWDEQVMFWCCCLCGRTMISL